MLNFLYVLRLLSGIGAIAPTLAQVPNPIFQGIALAVTAISEVATIILDQSPKVN